MQRTRTIHIRASRPSVLPDSEARVTHARSSRGDLPLARGPGLEICVDLGDEATDDVALTKAELLVRRHVDRREPAKVECLSAGVRLTGDQYHVRQANGVLSAITPLAWTGPREILNRSNRPVHVRRDKADVTSETAPQMPLERLVESFTIPHATSDQRPADLTSDVGVSTYQPDFDSAPLISIGQDIDAGNRDDPLHKLE